MYSKDEFPNCSLFEIRIIDILCLFVFWQTFIFQAYFEKIKMGDNF